MAAVSSFPSDLPARSRSWKDRNCPGIRTCWSFSLHSFSLRTSDSALLARRICMVNVLALRTAISVINCFWAVPDIARTVISVVLAIIGFFFIAWCLATIGEAQGYRRVLGLRVGRWHFDVFLFVMALAHVGLFVGHFVGLSAGGSGGAWIAMWLLIFGVAWIATWEPEPQSNV